MLRAIRARQWVKNLLLFVPLVTAHRFEAAALLPMAAAFVAFCLAASAVYLANDLLDLESDRRHPDKRHRPLASGELEAASAALLAPLLLLAAAVVALPLPPAFLGLLALYLAANVLYSGWLKRVALLDVFVLAGLYILRIVAGAAVIDVPVSPWLLGFSFFAFLSLAVAKRYGEAWRVGAREESRLGGRGYEPSDAGFLGTMGMICAFLSVLVFALYVTSHDVTVLYRQPAWLWAILPVLGYWFARFWFLALRGQLDEEPLVFAMRDPSGYVLAAVAGVAILMGR